MLSRIIRFLVHLFAGEFISTWVLPIVVTLGGIVIGVIKQVPLFYLYVGAFVLLAALSTGLLRFSEWRYSNRVSDKLIFGGVRVIPKMDETGCTTGIHLGVSVSNIALFPISFKVAEAFTKFDGHYPLKTEQIHNSISIPSQGSGFFDDNEIAISKKGFGAYKGVINCKLVFGKKDKLDHVLYISQSVMISFNGHGSIFNWQSYEYLLDES